MILAFNFKKMLASQIHQLRRAWAKKFNKTKGKRKVTSMASTRYPDSTDIHTVKIASHPIASHCVISGASSSSEFSALFSLSCSDIRQ